MYSTVSELRLKTCSDDIQLVFRTVEKEFPHDIYCGHRGEAEQRKAFAEGRSKVDWPKGRHNSYPANAVDALPSSVSFAMFEDKDPKIRQEAIKRMFFFAGFVLATASALGIELKWGGDWDLDKTFDDQSFNDWPHWETK